MDSPTPRPLHNDADERAQRIQALFARIAPSYDKLNHLLSFGFDRYWRRNAIKPILNAPHHHVLDLACGTGDLALALLAKDSSTSLTILDFCAPMLERGIQKIAKCFPRANVTPLCAPAENIPLPSNSMDAVMVAFGIRNVANLHTALGECLRVLKPKGLLVVLEFSHPSQPLFRKLYRWYFHQCLPTIGGWISGQKADYSYLPRSVDTFPEGQVFLDRLACAGFQRMDLKRLSLGIATRYTALKPQN